MNRNTKSMAKMYHILNGDALVDRFTATCIRGEKVVARECLIEGDLSGDTLKAFYHARAAYLGSAYGETPAGYFSKVVSEFEKLEHAPGGSEFNLWFGYDLFCRANMWFVLSLLQRLAKNKQVYCVYPAYLQGRDIWQDFGRATSEDLEACFRDRIAFTDKDLCLAAGLWHAFKHNDLAELERLSGQKSECFPYLEEVCRAHIERFPAGNEKSRPESVVAELLSGGPADFTWVYQEFFKREGIYGFGDVQVKRIYDKALQSL